MSALLRTEGESWRLEPGLGAEVVVCDLRDGARVRAVLAERRPQWVFHLAAHGAYSWQRDDRAIAESTLISTVNLIDALGEVECEALVHAGTSSEYGFKDHAPTEDQALAPNSTYAVGKAAATMQVRLAAEQHRVPGTTLRLYSVYGPWEDPRRMIPTLVVAALRGRLPPLAESGTARDFVFVDDVCEAFVLAAEAAPPGSIFNLGSGRQTTLAELVELVRELFAVEAEPRWGSMPGRGWDSGVWVADPAAIDERLRWRAGTALADGLERTAEWLRGHPELQERYGLPASAARAASG